MSGTGERSRPGTGDCGPAGCVFFFGVYSWLVKVLGQFSIIYFRGLGLRIGVRVWVRVGVKGLGCKYVWGYGYG